MEVELQEIFHKIRLYENLKECYRVKLYYLNSNAVGLSENELNELTLQKLLITKEMENIMFKLSYLYVEHDKLYYSLVQEKTKSSMQNDEPNTNGI